MLHSKSSVFVHPHVVFQSPHSWDRLLKPAFLVSESTDHVWAEGWNGQINLRFKKCIYPDTRGRGLKFLQLNVTALRVCCKWIHPLWAKHQLCMSITLVCTLLRRSLHDCDAKRPYATFCGGRRTPHSELLLSGWDTVIKNPKLRKLVDLC